MVGNPDMSPLIHRALHVWAGVALLVGIVGGYWALSNTGALDIITDMNLVRRWVVDLGAAGPIAVVALMVLAVVVSPIPSAPIALAAGALYGHTWGTLYILAGAEIGALIAFGLARMLGRQVVHRWFGDRLSLVPLLSSQWGLTAVVFASRLLPFVSFDIVSYAAGLTPLRAWRFAISTLVGILPASFLLAHLGGAFASGDPTRLALSAAILGLAVGIPILWRVITGRRAPASDWNGTLAVSAGTKSSVPGTTWLFKNQNPKSPHAPDPDASSRVRECAKVCSRRRPAV